MGTSGSTQGERKEAKPAPNAVKKDILSGSKSATVSLLMI
jgi:hypothetical protein